MAVRIYLEIGHEASIRTKKTQEGFTHDWEVFVRGVDGADIHHYVEKVVFHLHETFPKPKRVVKEPPYSVKESGYAGFNLPIEIYLRNNGEPKKVKFHYDLHLQQSGPAICKAQKQKYVFNSPTDEFKQKLLRGGGTIGSSSSMEVSENRSTLDEKNQLISKPKLSGSEFIKKQRFKAGEPYRDFQELFGSPILTTSKPIIEQKPQKPETKVSDKPRTKHSPHKDSHKDKDKSKDRSDADRKPKDDKKSKEKSKDRSKEKTIKKDKSPRPKSPSPKRSPKRPSTPPRFSSPPVQKHKHDRDKKEKDDRKSKKERRSKDHKENRHDEQNKSEEHKAKSRKTEAPSSPEKERPKEKPIKDSTKEDKDRSHSEKYKHKKRDKEKRDRKEEKSHRSEKKVDKAPTPVPEPKMSLFKSEPPPVVKKEKTYPSPAVPPPEEESSSSSTSSSDSSIVEKKTKNEVVKVKEEKNQKVKKEKGIEENSIKYKRKSNSAEDEEPPEKVQKEVALNNNSERDQEGKNVIQVKQDVEEDYFSILRDLQHKIMGLKENSDLQKVVQLIAETGRYEVSAHTFDFDLCLLDRSTVQQLQNFFANET